MTRSARGLSATAELLVYIIMIVDNGICMLFERYAKINKIFSTYDNFHSVSDFRCVIDELFFC